MMLVSAFVWGVLLSPKIPCEWTWSCAAESKKETRSAEKKRENSSTVEVKTADVEQADPDRPKKRVAVDVSLPKETNKQEINAPSEQVGATTKETPHHEKGVPKAPAQKAEARVSEKIIVELPTESEYAIDSDGVSFKIIQIRPK